MKSDKSHPDYFFGNTDAEHERLIRQAIRLAPVTERFFRDAGIAPGRGCGYASGRDRRAVRRGGSDRA